MHNSDTMKLLHSKQHIPNNLPEKVLRYKSINFGISLDLPKTLFTQLHNNMNPVIFNPAIKVPDNMWALCLHAQGRKRLHLLQVVLLLTWVPDGVLGHLYGIFKLISFILTSQYLAEVTAAKDA